MNMQTRHLNADESGIKIAPTAFRNGARLCDFCCMRETCMVVTPRSELERCYDFTPGLAFNLPLEGMEGNFSSLRASSIWYDRARVLYRTHKRIGVINAETGAVIQIMKLAGAYRGRFEDLMARFAHTNHLTLHRPEITRDEAPTWLAKQIRNRMGARYVKKGADHISTVLVLERL